MSRALMQQALEVINGKWTVDSYGYCDCCGGSSCDPTCALNNCIAALTAALAQEASAEKDDAYTERNRVVSALSKCFPSGTAKTTIEGWDEKWHGCVYVDLPTGQVSWHFHDSDAHLFSKLPAYAGTWDGHDTSEKYRRVAALEQKPPSSAEPVPENQKTWPKRIWLNHGADQDTPEMPAYADCRRIEAESWSPLITWCEDMIEETDIPYIRADLATMLPGTDHE